MNCYWIFVLSALFFEYIIDFTAEIFNFRFIKSVLPKEFVGVHDAASYNKSQKYSRIKIIAGIVESTFSLTVTLIFWFTGGFNILDKIVRGWDLSILITGVIYIGILFLFRAVIILPFSIYSTFVIEQKFGFNKTSPITFLADIIKMFFLSLVLGVPLLLGILAFYIYAGKYAWLYCWTVASIFILFIQFIAPNWIMPMFNKFTPLGTGQLRDSILSYTKSVNFPLKDIYVMNGSKRSGKSNALFTGFGKSKRIVLYDTLIQKHTKEELVTVLAHEIGHFKKKHIQQGIMISVLQTGLILFLMSFFIGQKELFAAFYMENVSVYAGVLFFGLLYTPIGLIISLLVNAISRKNEYEADRFSIDTTRQSEVMIEALKKLSVDNLSNLTPHPLYVFLNYSHPAILDRIKNIRLTRK